ncbi:uncharacterized protein PAE49_018646 isoform 2-T3 [Odontesthes bonariensis]
MERASGFKNKLFFLITTSLILMLILAVRTPSMNRPIPKPLGAPAPCPSLVSEESITPLQNTAHLLVSAYMDQRVKDFDVRIIGIFKRDSIQLLHCLFCCSDQLSTTTPARILPHSDHFGFPYSTTDVQCQIPQSCNATHVTLLTQPTPEKAFNQTWLPIRNKKTSESEERSFDLTVCISNLYGDYNNVLQYTQALEMYRLLGVDRVVIYNTSSGIDLTRVLQSYSQEGFVEIVPWPISEHLNPSHGWLHSEHGGDVHYFGQLTTLNECIYRSMQRSRYVLLHDIDEIIMPYQHDNLMSLMNMLQQQHPNVGEFLIENHIFPRKKFEPSGKFHLPQWSGVPGINILEHIHKEEPNRNEYHPHKMIIRPRLVEQTSVHEVLIKSGDRYKVPQELCRIINVSKSGRNSTMDQLYVDKRLWDFKEKLIPNVDRMLKKVGLLT